VFAIGTDVWIGGARGLLMRGDGTTLAPTTDTPMTPRVWTNRIYGLDPSRLWIATNDGIQVWDGMTLTTMAGTAGKTYGTVWASAADDVWVVDSDYFLWRWNGDTFQRMVQPVQFLFGTAANDVWADFRHWDGHAWTTTGALDEGFKASAMWASGSSDAWVVGTSGYVKHWDGASWNRIMGLGATRLTSVWGIGPSDVWVGGENETIERWDGQKWTNLNSVVGGRDVRGFAGKAGSVWVLGGDQRAMHWNGTTLAPSWMGTYIDLTSLWAGPTFGVFAGGGDGLLRHEP
jgi:hypothetical protein